MRYPFENLLGSLLYVCSILFSQFFINKSKYSLKTFLISYILVPDNILMIINSRSMEKFLS